VAENYRQHLSLIEKRPKGPFTGGLQSGAKREASAVYEHKA